MWALEGAGCYGAGLTRFLVDQGEWVVEIDRPKRPRGRHGAKSDVLDAVPEPLRDALRGRPWRQQLHTCTELVTAPGDPVEHRAPPCGPWP
jgi:hypothetical protein